MTRFASDNTLDANDYNTTATTGLLENATDGFGGNLTVGTAMNVAGGSDADEQKAFLDGLVASTAPANTVTNSEPITHEVSSFVSGSFGKLLMGALKFASKSHGVNSLSVGNGINCGITAVAGHHKSKKGL